MNSAIALEDLKMSLVKRASGMDLGLASSGPRRLGDVEIPDTYYNRISSGFESIDNLFACFVPGLVTTVAASRGAGKTTLLLQICQSITTKYAGKVKALYATNEEAIEQLAFNAERLGTTNVEADNVETVEDILRMMPNYHVMVVDSLAGLHTSNTEVNKSDVEVYATQMIYKAAKKHKVIVFLIQHMRKGSGKGNEVVALGKSSIEHTCDACMVISNLDLEDFGPGAKKIATNKNRFGCTGELLVRMTSTGFDLENPIADCSSKDNQEANEKNKNSGGPRAAQKVKEQNALVDFIKVHGKTTEKDLGVWADLPQDATGFDRTIRLAKGLTRMGKLIKIGDAWEIAK
jgi:predicted ATP-dependent serine protease